MDRRTRQQTTPANNVEDSDCQRDQLPEAAQAAAFVSARSERQLLPPPIPARVRARTLLDAAMMHNWRLQGQAFQRYAKVAHLSRAQQQDTFEMLWFRFKMEWRQLYSDALSEVDCIEPPILTDDHVLNQQILAEHHQEAITAFYPVVMMELFQKEVTFDCPTAEPSPTSVIETLATPVGESITAGSRNHWAQLYAQALREHCPPQTSILALPPKAGELSRETSAKSYDDLSSVGGFSDNTSFSSSHHSPSPWTSVDPSVAASPSEPVPPSPQQKRMEVLLRMASTEAPTVPIDFNTVKYDAEVRHSIVTERRERMKEILTAVL